MYKIEFYYFCKRNSKAQMAELVDALVSGTSISNDVQVRVLFWALAEKKFENINAQVVEPRNELPPHIENRIMNIGVERDANLKYKINAQVVELVDTPA